MKRTTEFLDIEDIKDGFIILKGHRYRAVITSDPINFALLAPAEQNALEDAFGSMLLSITFPIQILSLTQRVNLKDSLNAFRANRHRMPESMLRYEYELERFLSFYAENTMINQNYLIITYDDKENNYAKAKGEMSRRIQIVMEGLIKCGLNPKLLNTNELIDLIHEVLNPSSKIYASTLIENGALSFMKEGVELEIQPAQ
ncbi:hypothetical protein [Thermoanaerobacter sp. YS13]|uniref:hypothetical protein n=1 Tax=Thermoanaerobacter sp. YS13 TaxID=1511746 RepID=UPI0006925F49|nr:hypothetical protein [Thermoanaerobacter sp. YS13]